MSKDYIQNKVRRLRFDADEMTQQDLADKVGVSRQTVVAIEKGKYSPSLELAFKIAHSIDAPSSTNVRAPFFSVFIFLDTMWRSFCLFSIPLLCFISFAN